MKLKQQVSGSVRRGIRKSAIDTFLATDVKFFGISVSSKQTDYYQHRMLLPASKCEGLTQKFQTAGADTLIGFVNKGEYNYRTIDSILPLDQCFFKGQFFELSIVKIQDAQPVKKGLMQLSDNPLTKLARLDLFQPLDEQYRGGARFIFSSQILADKIYQQLVKPQSFFHKSHQFIRVNPIFRFNKFDPDDLQFKQHYDLPFVDTRKKQISRYSLLWYLTPGQKEDCLKFQSCSFNKIEQNQIIIFPISLLHSGRPYTTSSKIFIRTDLIFRFQEELEFSQLMARTFNSACYFALFSNVYAQHPSLSELLSKQATSLFKKHCKFRIDSSAQLSKQGKKTMLKKEIWFYEDLAIRKAAFITDGSLYYFPPNSNLKDSFIYAICDFFNCFPHISQEISTVLVEKADQIGRIIKKQLCAQLYQQEIVNICGCYQSYGEVRDCWCHHCQSSNNQHYVSLFRSSFSSMKFSILLNADNTIIKKQDIVISGNRIYFKNLEIPDGWNFASCTSHTRLKQTEFQGDQLNGGLGLFQLQEDWLLISLDFFKNGIIQRKQVDQKSQAEQDQ